MPDVDPSQADVPAVKAYEKAWWQSKKFFAFLLCEIGFFVLMGSMIYRQELDKIAENVAFMVLAVTSGMLATGFILGQGALDRYVRVAALTMGRKFQDEPSKRSSVQEENN
jgi:hypothetical protein